MTKHILTFCLLLFVAVSIPAQQSATQSIPKAVIKAFSEKVPGTPNPKWREDNGQFDASYTEAQKKYRMTFSADGSHIQTEIQIATEELPSRASAFILKKEPGKKIAAAFRIEFPDNTSKYRVDCGTSNYFFDSTGIYLESKAK